MSPPRGASAPEVQAHYDIGDAFYALWLDPERVYSAAMWRPDLDLAAAQRAKLAWHAQEAAVGPGSRVLDIGCGWGAFLDHAVRVAGATRAVGLTLSPSQAAATRARQVPGVEVHEEGWDTHRGTDYDAVVSVGAMEHFVRPEFEPAQRIAVYRAFFGACHAALRPGGRLSLQTIAYADFPGGTLDPFITERIFPGSDLPRLAELAEAHLGTFRLVRLRNDPQDYAQTCTVWAERLATRRAEAEALVGPERVRDFLRYLKMSAAGFRSGALDLLRMSFERR
jgi:cyclopropane-fatty-acyl-phospholipid synthase